MTQPSLKYKSMLFSDAENDKKAFDLLNKLESLLEMTNYKVDQCIYLHPKHSCTQCSVVRLLDELWKVGYSPGMVDRPMQISYFGDDVEIFLALTDVSDTMAKVSKKVRTTWRKEGQYFSGEVTIVEDLILEV